MINYKIKELGVIFGGIISVLIMTYFIFGESAFQPNNTDFFIILYGISGAIFYYLFEYLTPRFQYIGLVIIYLVMIIFFINPLLFIFALREFVVLLSIFMAMKYYTEFNNKYSQAPFFIRTIFAGLIQAVSFIVGTIVLLILYNILYGVTAINIYFQLLTQAKNGFYIGFSLGLGYDLFHYLLEKINYK